MSYASRDTSVEDGNPTLLFQFAQGSTVYRYALATESVVLALDGHTWTPAIMVPGELSHSNDVGKDSIIIEIATSDPLAATFVNGPPDVITTLTIFRVFTDPETEKVMCWKGSVGTHGLEPGKVILNCDPVWTKLQRPGLRRLYTKTCNHVLFGRGCNLIAEDFRSQVTITLSVGSVITLPINLAPTIMADGYFNGGYITAPDGTNRMITRHIGGQLHLIRPIKSLNDYIAAHPLTGASVYLFRGCDRSFTTCKTVFNNAGHYGGDPNFAQKNPFTTQVSFA